MYLGQSPVLDFAVCAGLGVAAVSCAAAAALLIRESARGIATRLSATAFGVLSFVLFGGSLLSIALILGETKASRDPNSILGFVAGAVLMSIVFFAALRRRS
jgi:hypothetical protein